MEKNEKSLTWIVIASSILVAFFGWGFMAGSYTGATSTVYSEMNAAEKDEIDLPGTPYSRRSAIGSLVYSLITFFGNSLAQIPNFIAVFSWHFSNRIWLPILIFLVECGVIGGGYALKKLEANLASPRYGRK